LRAAFSAQCLARDAWLARAPCYLADGDRMIGSRRIIGLDWILYRVVSMSRRTDGRSAASADRGSVQPSLPATRSSVVLNESLQTQHCIAEVVLSVVGIWKCDRKFTLVLPSIFQTFIFISELINKNLVYSDKSLADKLYQPWRRARTEDFVPVLC